MSHFQERHSFRIIHSNSLIEAAGASRNQDPTLDGARGHRRLLRWPTKPRVSELAIAYHAGIEVFVTDGKL